MIGAVFCVVLIIGAGGSDFTLDRTSADLGKSDALNGTRPLSQPENQSLNMTNDDPEKRILLMSSGQKPPPGRLNKLIYDAFGPPSNPSRQHSHAVTQSLTESSTTEMHHPDNDVQIPPGPINKSIYDAFGPPSNSSQHSHAVTEPVTKSSKEGYRPDEDLLNEVFGIPSSAESNSEVSLAEIVSIFGSPAQEKPSSTTTEFNPANNDTGFTEDNRILTASILKNGYLAGNKQKSDGKLAPEQFRSKNRELNNMSSVEGVKLQQGYNFSSKHGISGFLVVMVAGLCIFLN